MYDSKRDMDLERKRYLNFKQVEMLAAAVETVSAAAVKACLRRQDTEEIAQAAGRSQ